MSDSVIFTQEKDDVSMKNMEATGGSNVNVQSLLDIENSEHKCGEEMVSLGNKYFETPKKFNINEKEKSDIKVKRNEFSQDISLYNYFHKLGCDTDSIVAPQKTLKEITVVSSKESNAKLAHSTLSPNATTFEPSNKKIHETSGASSEQPIIDKENINSVKGNPNVMRSEDQETKSSTKRTKNKKKKKKKKKKENAPPKLAGDFETFVPLKRNIMELMNDYNLDSSYHNDNEGFSTDDYSVHSDFGANNVTSRNIRNQKHSMITRGHRVQKRWDY